MLLHRMLPLWTLLDPQHLDTSLPSWLSAVIPVVTDSRKASALIAAAYLREARKAAGIDGAAPVVLAATAAPEQVLTALTVTSLVTVRRALGAGQTVEQAMRTGYVTSSGAASRLALQGGQQTIVDSVRADPKARGWQRWPSPDACEFCLMLSDRGAVYSAETADFASHDHCSCVAAPAYGESMHVREFTPTTRNVSDADRTRTRAYLREHYSQRRTA